MKKTKDEPAATGTSGEHSANVIPSIQVVGSEGSSNDLDSANQNKEKNKQQVGTLRKIFARKSTEVYVPFL